MYLGMDVRYMYMYGKSTQYYKTMLAELVTRVKSMGAMMQKESLPYRTSLSTGLA